MNKKGTLYDIIVGLMFCFFFSILLYAFYLLYDKVISTGVFESTTTSSQIASIYSAHVLPTFDFILPAILFGIMVASIILTYNLPSNPELFIYNILLLFAGSFVAIAFHNAHEITRTSIAFNNISGNFTVTNYIFANILPIYLIFGFILIIVMLAVKRSTQIETIQ